MDLYQIHLEEEGRTVGGLNYRLEIERDKEVKNSSFYPMLGNKRLFHFSLRMDTVICSVELWKLRQRQLTQINKSENKDN